MNARIAQLAERHAEDLKVPGSNLDLRPKRAPGRWLCSARPLVSAPCPSLRPLSLLLGPSRGGGGRRRRGVSWACRIPGSIRRPSDLQCALSHLCCRGTHIAGPANSPAPATTRAWRLVPRGEGASTQRRERAGDELPEGRAPPKSQGTAPATCGGRVALPLEAEEPKSAVACDERPRQSGRAV